MSESNIIYPKYLRSTAAIIEIFKYFYLHDAIRILSMLSKSM